MRKWNLVVAWPDVTAKRLPDHDYQVFEGKLYFSPKEKLDGLQHRDPVGGGEHPLEVRSPFEPSCCEGSPTGSRGSSDDTLGASRVSSLSSRTLLSLSEARTLGDALLSAAAAAVVAAEK